ncbi:FAD-dependent oxidoreductase [Eggerthella sinensis]|uniref:FAD-dependent oxidoreductase n=1 Tax=Eggerthella sinensis TaxID=242230 RepID=UPI00266D9FCA|nr:FAD-dependent oxidoreductase [Eggerthella sinensis]
MERRAFFKLAGLSAAVLAVSGTLGACEAGKLPDNPLTANNEANETAGQSSVMGQPAISFGADVDVLIVGSGVSGLSAAIDPLEAKRSVMIVDKLDLLGGESFDSNGVMRIAGTDAQQQAGVKTTVDEAWDVRKKELSSGGDENLDFAKLLFSTATDWANRLASDYGAQFADPKTYTQNGVNASVMLPKNGLGDIQSIMMPLRDGLTNKGAMFSTGHRAVAFILNESGAPCGMRFCAEASTSVLDVRARRIVIATGGFASSQPLVHANTPDRERVGCYTVSSMGEGQQLCSLLGGQLVDMDKIAPLTSNLPQATAWGLFGPTVIVDALGHRFAREDDVNAAANACYTEERGYWWTVFGKQLTESSQSRSIAEVTSKNAKRLIGPFDTLDELAAGMGISADVLNDTFDRYGEFAKAGKDDDFGRTMFLEELEGPYYALKQVPQRYKTRGGVKTDQTGRVLSVVGAALPNVYCCGSVAAFSVGGLASNGAFGMLVGQAVAASLDDEDKASSDAESENAAS